MWKIYKTWRPTRLTQRCRCKPSTSCTSRSSISASSSSNLSETVSWQEMRLKSWGKKSRSSSWGRLQVSRSGSILSTLRMWTVRRWSYQVNWSSCTTTLKIWSGRCRTTLLTQLATRFHTNGRTCPWIQITKRRSKKREGQCRRA